MEFQDIVKNVLNQNVVYMQQTGGMIYGTFYTVGLDNGTEVFVKIFNSPNVAEGEMRQLKELHKFLPYLTPEVYGLYHDPDNHTDLLFTELMPGVQLSGVHCFSQGVERRLAVSIAETHLAIHEIINPSGFGDFDSETFSQNWETLFRSRIDTYYQHLTEFKKDPERSSSFSPQFYNNVDEIYHNFDKVFTQPVKEARLIHGDFTTSSILIEPKTFEITAVIGTNGCCYADRESDLFQYINHYTNTNRLCFDEAFKHYMSQVSLSNNFHLKNQYYFLWNELKHIITIKIYPRWAKAIEKIAQDLYDMLK